jgi:4-hydroxybenzoate polyprenyltransferase
LSRQLRLIQWPKNLLVFLPPLGAHQLLCWDTLIPATLAFFSLSLVCSAGYVVNDISDREADRKHPIRRHRPLAAGALTTRGAVGLAIACAGLGWSLALTLPEEFHFVLAGYLVLTLLYSYFLKTVLFLDVIILAILYTLRILAGEAATAVPVSNWLFAFSLFLFLSLAVLKRYSELLMLQPVEGKRAYRTSDTEVLRVLGAAAGYLSVVVLALYVNGDAVATLYSYPRRLWLACPIALFWVSRVWILGSRGEMGGDTFVRILEDWSLYVTAALIALVMVVAS